MYQFTKNEQKTIASIEETYYLQPAIVMINQILSISNNHKEKWKDIFNQLYEILTGSKISVDKLLEKRKKEGIINDISQARKSIAGNAFSNLVVYTFLNNKLQGNIKPNVYITSKKSEIKNFDNIATINMEMKHKSQC
jgi:type II restriction enzyme